MALNMFGGGPGDVTTNSAGDVVGGVTLKVYTAALGGQQATELYDVDGNILAGEVVSEPAGADEGRIAFQASDQYQLLFLDAGYGMRWAIPAREAFSAAYTALSKADEALTVADEAHDVAADAGVKADLASAEVDAKLGFDITRLAPQYVTTLKIPSNRIMQSAARDPLTGDYYVSQYGPANGSSTDLIITRCAPDGRMLSQCIFAGGGHGSTTAIENDGSNVWLWFRWTYDSTGGSYTNRMVRARYQPAETVLRNDPLVLQVSDFSDDSLVNFAIDQAADRISSRIAVHDTAETFVLRRLSDYKTGVDSPLHTIYSGDSEAGVDPYQGHVSIDDYLYVARGGSGFDAPCTITRYNWETGDKTLINVHSAGAMPDGSFPGGYNEMEGISMWRGAGGTPSLLFGKAMGESMYRQAPIYAFNPPAGDDLNGEVLRTISRTQGGEVLITPTAADTPTSVDVKFDREFNQPPIVQVTANTAVPATYVKGVSASDITTHGMKVWLVRDNTTRTGVMWRAEEI